MPLEADSTKENTTVFGSAVLGNALSPQQWVEVLIARDLPIKERTLREKANRLGACCKLGNAMIITGEQMDRILTEPDLCPSNPTSTRQATTSGSRVGSNLKGRGSQGHTVEPNAAFSATRTVRPTPSPYKSTTAT